MSRVGVGDVGDGRAQVGLLSHEKTAGQLTEPVLTCAQTQPAECRRRAAAPAPDRRFARDARHGAAGPIVTALAELLLDGYSLYSCLR